ncbi:MAG: polysaccharide lyase family protein, partial [Edaphobacter sp.]
MKSALSLISAAIVMAVCLPALAQPDAHSRPIFQIGVFNRSSGEFAGGAPRQPVTFAAGQSNPAKDWYATQPAVPVPASNSPVENIASAPRAISFSIDRAPSPSYHFHVALLVETASLPTLEVRINGKVGRFYLQPKLDWSMGDGFAAFDPVYSHADVAFDFPGSYLHQGSNTITLQAVEESDAFVPDANLTYDAIELDNGPAGFRSQSSTAQVLPTIFYQQRQGELDEMVELLVRYGQQPKPGSSADLVVAGKHYRQQLQSKRDFGEEKLEVAVPEFSAQTRAQLTWNVNGKVQHQALAINPQKKWTLFLVPHVHLDIGYSDFQPKVAAIQSRIIDEAMDLTAKHPDFRFSTDGSWNLEQFLKTRTPAEQQRVLSAIQKQQLFIPAQYANLLTGFPTAETLIRSLYPSANFSREHGTPFNYANITDVPSYSWSYASILASA